MTTSADVLEMKCTGPIVTLRTAISSAGRPTAAQLIGSSSIYMFPPDLPDQDRHDVMEAMDKLKVLPVRLPEADYERLRRFAADRGFSMAVVVRTLVERFLTQQRQA